VIDDSGCGWWQRGTFLDVLFVIVICVSMPSDCGADGFWWTDTSKCWWSAAAVCVFWACCSALYMCMCPAVHAASSRLLICASVFGTVSQGLAGWLILGCKREELLACSCVA
jgi:hypothetical protein